MLVQRSKKDHTNIHSTKGLIETKSVRDTRNKTMEQLEYLIIQCTLYHEAIRSIFLSFPITEYSFPFSSFVPVLHDRINYEFGKKNITIRARKKRPLFTCGQIKLILNIVLNEKNVIVTVTM